jgi:hypothetical protein
MIRRLKKSPPADQLSLTASRSHSADSATVLVPDTNAQAEPLVRRPVVTALRHSDPSMPASHGRIQHRHSTQSPPTMAHPTAVEPRSKAEHYWAARALAAETLLSARTNHERETRAIAWSQDQKRTVCSYPERTIPHN